MLGENYVYFFTVQGFFIGIIFGILKSFDASGLFIYTSLITIFFYLFSHIIIALYYKTLTARSYDFPRDRHESDLDIFVKEINKRERLIDSAIKITDAAIKMNSDDYDGKAA
ncbi:Motility integral membrane protein [hydrothermal vent metagenome]|uniref:Motility integral membrane protein n=1 Tax=hydrothermal vent metagenome TaxID=652676 RepID=A0A1W1BN81_9ZZZZ